MKNLVANTSFLLTALALSLLVLIPPTEAQAGVWDYSQSNENVCAFVEIVLEFHPEEIRVPGPFICADWLVDGQPQHSCCIPWAKLGTSDPGACLTTESDPSTDERPNL